MNWKYRTGLLADSLRGLGSSAVLQLRRIKRCIGAGLARQVFEADGFADPQSDRFDALMRIGGEVGEAPSMKVIVDFLGKPLEVRMCYMANPCSSCWHPWELHEVGLTHGHASCGSPDHLVSLVTDVEHRNLIAEYIPMPTDAATRLRAECHFIDSGSTHTLQTLRGSARTISRT